MIDNRRQRRWLLVPLFIVAACLVGIVVILIANARFPTASADPAQLNELDRARLAEAQNLRHRLGDDVWPGFATAPLGHVVYNEANAFVVGVDDPPPGWYSVPWDEHHGGRWTPMPGDTFIGETYYRLPLPESGATPQAFTVRVGDGYASSMQTREWMRVVMADQLRAELPGPLAAVVPYDLAANIFLGGSDFYIMLTLHEAFHAFQATEVPERLEAAERAARREDDYPFTGDAHQEAWQAELTTLVEAARAASVDETAGLAADFLELRRQRRAEAGLTAAQIAYEQEREWLEGTAKYVELEMWRQARLAEDYEPRPEIAADPDFAAYEDFEQQWTRELDQAPRMYNDHGDGRFYYSGMLQAVLLDRLAPGWKQEAFAAGVYLDELLTAAIDS